MDYLTKLIFSQSNELHSSSYCFHLISGYLITYQTECQSNPLFYNEESSNNKVPIRSVESFKDPLGLRFVINKLYSSNLSIAGSISNNKPNKRIDSIIRSNIDRGFSTCLSYMYFLVNIMKNYYQAAVQISIAEEFKNGILNRHLIKKAKYYLEKEIVMKSSHPTPNQDREDLPYNEKGIKSRLFIESQIDPRLVIIYEERLSNFQTLLIKTSRHYFEFWRELSYDKPDLKLLHKQGMEILISISEINNIWNKLSSISDYYSKANVIYGKFLKNIIGNNEEGQYFLLKVIPETELENINGSLSILRLSFSQNTGVVCVSAMPNTLGTILKSSENIKNLFGFNNGELLGQPMQILIPDFLDNYHQLFVEKYLKTGEGKTIEKLHQIFGSHKSGYLVPLNLLVKHYYDIHYESVFSAFFTHYAVGNEFIITNEFGQIIGLTEGAGTDLGGVSPSILLENEVFIYYFLPELIGDKNSGLNSLSKLEGNFSYKCMIPRSTLILITLLRGGREQREEEKSMKDGHKVLINKLTKQDSKKHIQQIKYFSTYKNCDTLIMNFKIENIRFPEMNVCFKIFRYVKTKKKYKTESCIIDNLIHTRESALEYLSERRHSSADSALRIIKGTQISHSSFGHVALAQSEEEKVAQDTTQVKDQSSVLNLVEEIKETTPLQDTPFDSSLDDDRLKTEIRELRESTNKTFDHKLVHYLRWLARLVFLFSVILASVGIYLQSRIDNNCSNLVSGISKNRLISICRISESSRILLLMTSYSVYQTPLINATERSNLFNYSSFSGSPTDYLQFRKIQLKENTDLLFNFEYNGLWIPLLIDDLETQNELYENEEYTTYEGMSNQEKTEIGKVYTMFNMMIDRAFTISNTDLLSLSSEKQSLFYILINGLYNFDFHETAFTIQKGINKEYNKREKNTIIILICSCILSILSFIVFTFILYFCKVKNIEAMKLLFDIKQSRAQTQATVCSLFERDIESELGEFEEEDFDLKSSEQIRVEADLNSETTPQDRSYQKYSGNFLKILLKFIIFLLIILGYYLQSYFVSRYFKNYVLKYNDEYIRIKQIRTNNDLIHAFFYEMIGIQTEVEGHRPYEYLTNLLSAQIVDVKTQSIIHKSHSYQHDYQITYREIIENSVCSFTENITECSTILGGSLNRGLSVANSVYLSKFSQLVHDYHLNVSISVNTLQELINSKLAIELEVVCIRYLGVLYDKVLESLEESIQSVIFTDKLVSLICFILFCVYLLGSFLYLRFSIISTVRQDLFISNAILSIIPYEIILRTPSIKQNMKVMLSLSSRSL